MDIYRGIGVFDAIAVGKAKVFRPQSREKPGRENLGKEAELQRLSEGALRLTAQLKGLGGQAVGESAEIFEIHQMMVEDEDFRGEIETAILSRGMDAVSAVEAAGVMFAHRFRQMESEYMQARAADIEQIAAALVDCLSGDGKGAFAVPELAEDVVLFAHDLSPAQTLLLGREHLLAIVTAGGSVLSHTAILAKSMGIPAIVGVGEDCLDRVREGETVIADGESGKVILSPDRTALEQANIRVEAQTEEAVRREALKDMDAITVDGKTVELFANIGSLEELDVLRSVGAQGIGLFRSEFLYLGRERYPTEEEQFTVYRKIVEEMQGKRVIIRTLDIGADKKADYFGLSAEENPAMGLRAIRLCLARPEMFRTQLRALYRASAYGKLSILFPMITAVWECKELLAICDEVKRELAKEGLAFALDVPLGVMIETPGAALVSDRLAELMDFFSIGTNDLIQYTLACDRQNSALGRYFDPHHPAILRLIEMTVANARRYGVWVGICGELAADLTLTETFLRMGVNELSASPAYLLRLKERVRSLNLSK